MADDSRGSAGPQGERLPEVVVQFAVNPGATLSWRVNAGATLRVLGARIRVTRIRSPYDHWLSPASELLLQRGERVWICNDGDVAAFLSLTRNLPVRRNLVSRWFAAAANSQPFAGKFPLATGSIHRNQVAVKQDPETE
ncbi:DUF2917 domain-containing protein [Paraburkholderia nemoris]|uniref:DUF2917 domain-containing protein n=1 Tax=Paraburkholderia nemoris TaxID=2793076 RepID=UPI001F38A821|nr:MULTISPECIES: DUF2917 domain-containing protein [Paraburkholderia]